MAASIFVCIAVAGLLCISSSEASLSKSVERSASSFPISRKFGGMIVIRSVYEEALDLKGAEGPVHSDVEGPFGVLEGGHSKKHNRGTDPSIAGGGVILGGLATTFLFAIFCYIRATRKATAKSISDSGSSGH